MSLMETLTTPELEDVAADEWLDYDIRIWATEEIYRRRQPSEREEYAKTENE